MGYIAGFLAAVLIASVVVSAVPSPHGREDLLPVGHADDASTGGDGPWSENG